jgi:uncharacterized membrane protein YuzA (DUF378 family)
MGINRDYMKKKIYGAAILVLVLAGLNWGFVAIFKGDAISSLFGKDSLFSRIFFIIVAACAVYVGSSRDSYLPFLGQTVLPCSVLQEKIPDKAELKVRIIAPAGHKVLYWASEPDSDAKHTLKNWQEAYEGFENAGVAIAESDGSALLQVRRPQAYWTMPGNRLEPHVHYRICGNNGMMGPVRSLFIEERVEGFGTAIHL